MRKKLHHFIILFVLVWGSPQPGFPQVTPRMDSLQLALNLAQTDLEKCRILLKLAKEIETHDVKKSLAYAQEVEKLSLEKNFSEAYREALLDIGTAYFRLGLMDESVKYRTRYLDLVEESGTEFEKTIAYVNLGGNWIIKGDYKKAETLFLKALQHYKTSKVPPTDSSLYLSAPPAIYNNLSYIYRETGKLDQARLYINLGLDFCQKHPQIKEDYFRLRNNESLILLAEHKLPEARDVLTDVQNRAHTQGNTTMEATTLYDLAKVYDMMGLQDSSLWISQLAMQLSQQLDNNSLIKAIAEQISGLFEKIHRSDSALKYLNLARKYDSIMKNDEARELLIRHDLHSEFEKREQRAQEEYLRKQYLLGGILVFMVMTAFFTIFKFWQSRKKVKLAQLAKLETELAANKLSLEKLLLEEELETREKKMATDVMYQIKKNEMINGVVQKLMDHSQTLKSESREFISEVIRDLEKTQEKSVWTEFELRFQDVHKDFYDQLQLRHPDLSANERRLCAFLKLNMSTKEISTITGQSFHSINVARTRLRKKLNLTHSEKGLVEYLATIG